METPAIFEPFEYHEGPPALTPDDLGAGWPYDKSGLEQPEGGRAQEEPDEAQAA